MGPRAALVWSALAAGTIGCAGVGGSPDASAGAERSALASPDAVHPADASEPAPSDEARELVLVLDRLALAQAIEVLASVEPGWTVDPAEAELALTLETRSPLARSELAWTLQRGLAPHGLVVVDRHIVRARPVEAPPDVATVLVRTRSPDASRSAALADRVWRGRLSVGHRGDLLALTGPPGLIAEAIEILGERDHVSTDPTAAP